MTPKISLVTVVAVALVAVPAAWGKGQGITVSPDAFERAAAAQVSLQSTPIVSPDAVDRMRASSAQSRPITSPDAVDRAVASRADYGNRIVFDDRFNEATNVAPVSSSTSAGRELEWPQIGMGFGLGLALALGLFMAMRYTRIRPLAH